jgi:hypothetical protein
MRVHRGVAGSVGAVLLFAGCASAPPMAGSQGIHLAVVNATQQLGAGPSGGWRGMEPAGEAQHIPGVRCEATNDRGSWHVATPGRLEVAVSSVPLKVTCRREGYRDAEVKLKCITPP